MFLEGREGHETEDVGFVGVIASYAKGKESVKFVAGSRSTLSSKGFRSAERASEVTKGNIDSLKTTRLDM